MKLNSRVLERWNPTPSLIPAHSEPHLSTVKVKARQSADLAHPARAGDQAGFPSQVHRTKDPLKARTDGIIVHAQHIRGEGRRAFTLVEVLAAISVIALLLSLLLPALSQSRKKAVGTFCLQNIRNIGHALELYSNDSNASFPVNIDGYEPPETCTNWIVGNLAIGDRNKEIRYMTNRNASLLWAYASDLRLWRCPTDRKEYFRSFNLNCRINPVRRIGPLRWVHPETDRGPLFRSQVALTAPSSTFTLIEESETTNNDPFFVVDLSNTGNPEGKGAENRYQIVDEPATRHSGFSEAFADGHAESSKCTRQELTGPGGTGRPRWVGRQSRIGAKLNHDAAGVSLEVN